MMKKIIQGYGSAYNIEQIELGNIKNNFYLKFYFSDETKAESFRKYLKTSLIIITNESEQETQFRELDCNDSSKNTVFLIGNISQAIDFFKVDELFSNQLKEILENPNEAEIQKILNASKKCTQFLSTIPVKPYKDYSFFNSKVDVKDENERNYKWLWQ